MLSEFLQRLLITVHRLCRQFCVNLEQIVFMCVLAALVLPNVLKEILCEVLYELTP